MSDVANLSLNTPSLLLFAWIRLVVPMDDLAIQRLPLLFRESLRLFARSFPPSPPRDFARNAYIRDRVSRHTKSLSLLHLVMRVEIHVHSTQPEERGRGRLLTLLLYHTTFFSTLGTFWVSPKGFWRRLEVP